MLMLVLIVFLAILVVGCALSVWVVLGTLRKTRAGINVNRIVCPRCGAPQPAIRKPKSVRQAMWGGSTCPQCGLEMDKWGRAVA